MKKITPLVILLAVIMVMSSISVTVNAVTIQLTGLDYSNPSSPVTIEMGNVEFMKFLTGEEISDVEAEYLESTVGDMFIYSDVIPQKYVDTTSLNETLSVSAKEYTYIANDGTAVKWIPVAATFEGKKAVLELSSATGNYEGKFESVEATDTEYLTVEYTCTIELKASTVDSYKNYTYNYAHGLWKENEDYTQKLAAYEAYQKYLVDLKEYNILKAEWNEYNKEYTAWSDKEQAYNTYINVSLPEYQKAYAKWQAYEESIKDLPQKIKEYEAYLVAGKQ